MKLTTQIRYGTRAALELALNYNQGPVKKKDIIKEKKVGLN